LLLLDFQLRKTSSRCFGRQRPEIIRNSTLTMQCFDTFRGFLHKLYAATMDGKGREGTMFSHDWGQPGAQGIGHRGSSSPCQPAGAAHGENRTVINLLLNVTAPNATVCCDVLSTARRNCSGRRVWRIGTSSKQASGHCKCWLSSH